MFDLLPEVETTVREHAEREGVSINELLARTFPSVQSGNARSASLPADDPIWAALQSEITDAAGATPEEIASDEAAYLRWQQNMDAPRRANGERLLFPNVPPK